MIMQPQSPEKSVSASEMNKFKQKRRILELLHSHSCLSAPELSKHLKTSLPTSIQLLNDLVALGYVKNIGVGESSGGRKPTLYSLPDDNFLVLACDFARFSANMVVLDSSHRFVTPVLKIDTHMDDPEMVEKVYQSAQKLLRENGISEERICGIGVDMPGLIDSKTGVNFTIRDKKNRTVGDALRKRFDKMVYVDNDARMHANGEFHFGAAKDYKNAIIIHWSWGLGLGIYVNGQLYSGNNGFAGELSHIPMVENGDLCICGKRGCLETVASSNTVMKLVRQGFERNEVSPLIYKFKDHPEAVTPEDVILSARTGDEFCISILNDVGKAMGKGLSYIIQLLNPEVIVLSGPLSTARQYVLSPIQQSLNRLCLEKISGNTKLIISDRGDESALLGTSEMVLEKYFSEMSFSSFMKH